MRLARILTSLILVTALAEFGIRATWGLSRFSRSENGTVPFQTRLILRIRAEITCTNPKQRVAGAERSDAPEPRLWGIARCARSDPATARIHQVVSARAPSDGRPSKPRTVRVAGIVLKWIRGDKEANLRRIEPMIREAAANRAQIVVTTECFLDGYAIADKSIPLEVYRAWGEPIPDGKCYRRLAALAAELKIHLVAGMLEADGEHRYNTAVLIGPDGKLIGKYHKQKLGHESVRNTAGDASLVFDTPYGRVGLMICADRTEEDIVRRFCGNGAEFLICPSGGMFGPKTNDPIVQSRSRENRVYIVFVHPAEFLVTGPDGSIVRRTILGDRLLIPAEQAGGENDQKRVFYFDLPLVASERAHRQAEPAAHFVPRRSLGTRRSITRGLR